MRYQRISIKIGVFARTGEFGLKFQVQGTATNHSSCQKTRINVLSYGTKMWAQVSFVLSQCTRLTHGRADGRTDRKAFAICIRAFIIMQAHGNKMKTILK